VPFCHTSPPFGERTVIEDGGFIGVVGGIVGGVVIIGGVVGLVVKLLSF